ncbi:hypothetical protein NTPn39_09685 [Streptococcus pneumoniae]|nr:hypothetical protein NTPn39_09685 [Streptococcus pneumoniae]
MYISICKEEDGKLDSAGSSGLGDGYKRKLVALRLLRKRKNIYIHLDSIKIKEQTRKLAAGCSKYCFEVADGS